jgi:uncharacterized protein YutE (UPF0331/DUF86 family)
VIDPDRVRRLVVGLQHWHAVLAAEPTDVYRRRYAVQSAAQATIDLANHVIAANGWRVPANYGDAFKVLAEHEVIDDALAERLRALAGLRNLLVHHYDDIDDERVASEATRGLGDLDAYARAVVMLLDQDARDDQPIDGAD